ncbi:metal dependent phosphohydrolase [Denitrovibrio acetiphilus DSM 12809]|uniref:Metal dependent phosphohydrolase n=1 Tax=Denitrovibrio acetiphilus (strain DSM 12809 / NBRC 114555 / N2460) TaxID=522772 RepID=D4H5L8_DENA2|nr:HDOD domain-containing protein [Denitrovibrio acetiphilus]ADD69459.1 metal dependent phosphohydrolase [Denitrovibrio acetiphilus DSM 12809]
MKILYIGSQKSKQIFQQALGKSAELTSEKNADACLIEINDTATLFKLPKQFSVPTYFYLTVKDRKVIEVLKDFRISGVFFPPLKPEEIQKKFTLNPAANTTKTNGNEFDTLKAKIIAKAENIPPLPALAKELVRLTRNDKTQMKDFIEKIKMDQGLSSRIIKLVNSPFYGLRQDVSSIDRATVLLGLNTVKNIALAVSTEHFFKKNFNLYKTTGQKLWDHSFLVARLSEILGKACSLDEDALYLAGLMHDIGKTVLVDFLVKEADTVDDERQQLGTDHCAVGELVLHKWSVVSVITDAVRTHHWNSTDKFKAALYFANRMAKEKYYHETAEDASIALGLSVGEILDLLSPVLEAVGEGEDVDETTEETS